MPAPQTHADTSSRCVWLSAPHLNQKCLRQDSACRFRASRPTSASSQVREPGKGSREVGVENQGGSDACWLPTSPQARECDVRVLHISRPFTLLSHFSDCLCLYEVHLCVCIYSSCLALGHTLCLNSQMSWKYTFSSLCFSLFSCILPVASLNLTDNIVSPASILHVT